MVLPCSLLARAEVPLIVHVHAVRDGVKAAGGSNFFHHGEELIFAVKASLPVVADIFGTVEFRGRNHLDRDGLLLSKRQSIGKLGASEAGRVGNDRQHVARKYLTSDPRKIGRINASGVGNKRATEPVKTIAKQRSFRVEAVARRLHHKYVNSSRREAWRAFWAGAVHPTPQQRCHSPKPLPFAEKP